MDAAPVTPATGMEWGVASIALPGERLSGDAHVICPFDHGVLVGVADGLGHGPEAAAAAARAMEALRSHPRDSVIGHVRRCHQLLAGTRGAVMSVARVDLAEHTMSWMSVGNVQGLLLRADPHAVPRHEMVLSRRGVVGLQLPLLQATVTTLAPGDLVLFATDGVGPSFAEHVVPGRPQTLAERLLHLCNKGTDDALVLVGAFPGD